MIEIIGVEQFKKKQRAGIEKQVFERVEEVMEDIEKKGFEAVQEYSKMFDRFDLGKENIKISEQEIEKSPESLSAKEKEAIDTAFERVEKVQKAIAKNALAETREDVGKGYVLFKPRAIERVGIYVPGGVAPLPSSLLMAGVTAKAAGVKEIIICTPPQKDRVSPAILYVAKKIGVKDIYQIGGAQAIAAMVYGLERIIPKVDMVCGPGNVYAAAAKQLAFSKGLVKIDLIAGPSEVLIIADEKANPEYIAADMLAQAEHGVNSPAIMLTDSKTFAQEVKQEVEKQLSTLKNNEVAKKSIKDYSSIVVLEKIEQAADIANNYAPEHLEVFLQDSESIISKLTNAGALFVNTCESFADYGMSGGNHILPTEGTARFLSGLSVYEFIIRTYVEYMTDDEQAELAELTSVFAAVEGLEAHSKAARLRARVD